MKIKRYQSNDGSSIVCSPVSHVNSVAKAIFKLHQDRHPMWIIMIYPPPVHPKIMTFISGNESTMERGVLIELSTMYTTLRMCINI